MKMKNAWEQIQAKGITTWADLFKFLDGKKATVLSGSHNYPKTFTISIKSNYASYRNNYNYAGFSANTGLSDICKGKVGNSIYLNQFVIGGNSLEDLKKELEELETEFFSKKEELNAKIELLEKFQLDEFDDLMLKAHKIYKNLALETKEEFQKVYKSLL